MWLLMLFNMTYAGTCRVHDGDSNIEGRTRLATTVSMKVTAATAGWLQPEQGSCHKGDSRYSTVLSH